MLRNEMRQTAFIVISGEGSETQLFRYDSATAREAVLEHGLPGRFAVLEALVYEASVTESLDVSE